MPKVEFGPLYTTMEQYIGPVEFAEKAEGWGYDYYWVPDYVTLSPMDAFVLLSAVGQRTSSIKLGRPWWSCRSGRPSSWQRPRRRWTCCRVGVSPWGGDWGCRAPGL